MTLFSQRLLAAAIIIVSAWSGKLRAGGIAPGSVVTRTFTAGAYAFQEAPEKLTPYGGQHRQAASKPDRDSQPRHGAGL